LHLLAPRFNLRVLGTDFWFRRYANGRCRLGKLELVSGSSYRSISYSYNGDLFHHKIHQKNIIFEVDSGRIYIYSFFLGGGGTPALCYLAFFDIHVGMFQCRWVLKLYVLMIKTQVLEYPCFDTFP
jgi:hypothetical protein